MEHSDESGNVRPIGWKEHPLVKPGGPSAQQEAEATQARRAAHFREIGFDDLEYER